MNSDAITFAKALADDTRQEIMKLLCCRWLNVSEVVEALGGKVNQPTVSHHLKLLAAANLVYVREEGRQHFYSLNQEYFTECCGRLMQRFAPDYATDLIQLESLPETV